MAETIVVVETVNQPVVVEQTQQLAMVVEMPIATIVQETVQDVAVDYTVNQTVEVFEGPPGPPGEGDKTFRFVQTVASDTWVIPHNLNKYVSVSIVDTAGTSWMPDQIQYNSLNQVTVSFRSIMSGEAYCN